MFKIRYRDVEEVLQLFGDGEVFDHPFCLRTKVSIERECGAGVDVGHFKVVFFESLSGWYYTRRESDRT